MFVLLVSNISVCHVQVITRETLRIEAFKWPCTPNENNYQRYYITLWRKTKDTESIDREKMNKEMKRRFILGKNIDDSIVFPPWVLLIARSADRPSTELVTRITWSSTLKILHSCSMSSYWKDLTMISLLFLPLKKKEKLTSKHKAVSMWKVSCKIIFCHHIPLT